MIVDVLRCLRHCNFGEEDFWSLTYFYMFLPPRDASPLVCTSINALDKTVIHNKFDQNWARTFWEDIEIWIFPIHMYNTMWTLTPKCITCFSMDPLDLYIFDSGWPEVSKYLNSLSLCILVLEKKIFWSLI